MNTKVIIAALSGVIVGGIGGYFVAKNRAEKKYEALADARIDKMEKAYREWREEAEATIEASKDDKPEEDITEKVEKEAVKNEYIKDIRKEDEEVKKVEKKRRVEFISSSELDSETDEDFDCVRYYWYEDGVLELQETGSSPMTDIDEIVDEVGVDFRDEIKDKSAVYIRDYSLELDYVIERAPLTYKNAHG